MALRLLALTSSGMDNQHTPDAALETSDACTTLCLQAVAGVAPFLFSGAVGYIITCLALVFLVTKLALADADQHLLSETLPMITISQTHMHY